MIAQKVYEFFVRFRDYIVYTLLVVISLSLISLGDFSTISGMRASIVAILGFINDKVFIFPNVSALQKENQILRELNIELSNEVTKNYLAEKENKQLRKLLELKTDTTAHYEFADVVGIEKIGNKNFLLINKGTEQGVKFGMPVRTDAGLIGTIAAASKGYSIIETIYNADVHISVSLTTSNTKGILSWDGMQDLVIDNIPKTLVIEKNEEVVTSNFSSRFPSDIPIGRVKSVEIPKSSLFFRIVVEPYSYFSQVQQVIVIKELPDTNKVNLINQYFKSN